MQSVLPLHRSCSLDRDEDQPSTSAAAMTHAVAATDTMQDAEQSQQMAQRVLLATAICGSAGASGPAATAADQQRPSTHQSVGVSTSPPPLSDGRELSTAGGSGAEAQPTTPNSAADDGTDGAFRDGDDSLNISLTLGLPSTTVGSPLTSAQNQNQKQNQEQSQASNCTEHTYLKRSWLLVHQTPHGPSYRVQRLRHTFSSPEAFTAAHELHLPYPDFLSYGTNMPHERSSSNFGSELSRDPSSCSIGKRARLGAASEHSESQTVTPDVDCSNQTLQSPMTEETRPHTLSESESEAEQQVSCFGAVSQRPKRRRGHVRSRSFSNARGAGRRRLIQRSSSADLLMNYAAMAVSTPQKRSEGLQRLFFI